MRVLSVVALSLLLSGCSLFRIPKPETPAPEAGVNVVQRALDNTIALVDTSGVFCSGVAAEGVFLTAAHCVTEGEAFEVAFRGKLYPGLVVLVDEAKDIAIVDALGARVKDTVPLSELDPVIGQKVVWLGYPLGMELVMGTGIVGNPRSGNEGLEGMLVVYGQFIPGNSGGPVFDERGLLIGLVSATMTFRQGLVPVGYAVNTPDIRAALQSL